MRRRVTALVAVGLLAMGLGITSRGVAAAPPEPQPVTLECATDMTVQLLGNATPASAPDQALVLVRAAWAPGGGIGPHTHPGDLVVTVESGAFGFTLEEEGMEMTIMRVGDAGTPAVPEPLTAGEEVILQPGDWFVETGMVHSARNAGDEPVTTIFTGLVEAGQPLTTCVG
jgi:quercetin dioxygenase-like cupin family protein